MEAYVTEDQQVEAIKKWWKENGSSIIVGVVLGLAMVFGIRTWNDWRAHKAEAASEIYQQLAVELQKGQAMPVQQLGGRLMEEYPTSVYAMLGALAEAAVMVNQGDPVSARGRLEWVITQTSEPHIKGLAELRLGRLLLEQGDTARTVSLCASAAAAGFQAAADELKGDVLRAQGDNKGALGAYSASLAALPAGSEMAANLRLKIDDLGGVR